MTSCPHTGTTHDYVTVAAFLKMGGTKRDYYEIQLECELCGAVVTIYPQIERSEWKIKEDK